MHIKRVIILGFRSYKEQTIVEPFSPRHNVIVGKNGSGKSNFFGGIQFVLSEDYSPLRPEQRRVLLHEGTGPRALNAFVEIIFDNTDRRLPIDQDEVSIRRVIGSKKDQYFLNRKMVTRTDIMDLLESAGFSRSNPYYIVKQGKINQIATAPDSERLKLLKEIAGTRVYDEKREESKNILKETEGKRERIEDLLKYIEERLATLEEEKEELKSYQKWDKMRRSVEYTICDHELKETCEKLDALDTRKETGHCPETEELRDKLKDASDHIKDLDKEVREAGTKVQGLKDERDMLFRERSSLFAEKTRLELTINDLKNDLRGEASSQGRLEQDLEHIKGTIQANLDRLELIRPQYEEQKYREAACARELSLKEKRRTELYAKQGRWSQFSSKEERDEWIRTECESLQNAIADTRKQMESLLGDSVKYVMERRTLKKEIASLAEKLENCRVSIDNRNKSYYELKKNKDALQTKRTELWRQELAMKQSIELDKAELLSKNRALRSMISRSIMNGRDSVKKVIETFREEGEREEAERKERERKEGEREEGERQEGERQEGEREEGEREKGEREERERRAKIANDYYGILAKNFNCDRAIYTAVEVASGNKLFCHVVEDDRASTEILKEMNKQNLPGEVTFIPLNRFGFKDIQYPDTTDAVPMIRKLNYDTVLENAMRYIYGKTLICRDLEVATRIARTSNLNCITLDGDQVSHTGALTGGYFDPRRSRFELLKSYLQLEDEICNQDSKLKEHKKALDKVQSNIEKVEENMLIAKEENIKTKHEFHDHKREMVLKNEQLSGLEGSCQQVERMMTSLDLSLASMEATEQSLRDELQQELLMQLSVSEQEEVETLNEEIHALTQENQEAFNEWMTLEAEKNNLENLLNNNLYHRKEELETALQEMTLEGRRRRLEGSSADLLNVNKRIDDVNQNIKVIEKARDSKNQEVKELQLELEKWKNVKQDLKEKLGTHAKDLDTIARKQALLRNKKDEYMKRIRELGPLPSDAFERYQDLSLEQLFQRLEEANRELKNYGHVNKKALDQFINFSEQKEKLVARMDELQRGHDSIVELMNVLEMRKSEAIQLTFKQVSKYFSEVFKNLVPQGHATLVMKTDDPQDAVPSVEQFTGVGIRVSFTGRAAEMKEMQQLSGGQKCLVALALIFAIQKCDPAPFYLFDEIDQALDSQHRKAVAEMIHVLCKDAQFITTTFRKELLEKADKFYGVTFANNVSHIEAVTREEARGFLEDATPYG